ncbi:hypothetical protein SI65_05484 [Aspergillus cristatus]|uniref:Nudix hydrolase domain-containing protein n=1 Tax=Aspergillus cristatus TaxID=573508 RepID=A0A1E3BD59_ASPCR|nr:hypothetical protein SI65_05484 [Aspergillus cristatus]
MSTQNKRDSKPKSPSPPRPSSSVLLLSPQNEILLLHRVKTSTSFASAHVFPGGNLSPQDGPCPPTEDLKRHDDAPWYRRAALRELFEESGILLAKDEKSGEMITVSEEERERGRMAIHGGAVEFGQWLEQYYGGAVPDIDKLIPFTRWITPTNVPKRFTTQMYLYFLPLPVAPESEKRLLEELPEGGKPEQIHLPTSDGGIEVTEARFLPACEWLRLARAGEIILFPPQFLLLHLVSEILDKDPRPVDSSPASLAELERRRAELVKFVHSGTPPWTEKCISPKMLKMAGDGRAVLGLDHPGPELGASERKGESERVVIVRFGKGEAREVDVASRDSVSKL